MHVSNISCILYALYAQCYALICKTKPAELSFTDTLTTNLNQSLSLAQTALIVLEYERCVDPITSSISYIKRIAVTSFS